MSKKERIINAFLSHRYFKEKYKDSPTKYIKEARELPSSHAELAVMLFLIDMLEKNPEISGESAYKDINRFFNDSAI